MALYTCDVCGCDRAEYLRGFAWCDACSNAFSQDYDALEKWELKYRRQVFDAFAIAPNLRSSSEGVVQRVERAIGRTVQCEPEGPFESRDWWYVREYSIGCSGFIVDKRDDNVMGLGSACQTEQQFKNYDAGFRHDLVDLTINRVLNHDESVHFLSRRGLWHNPRNEVSPEDCPSNGPVTEPSNPTSRIIRWTKEELSRALESIPKTFRSQRINPRSFIDPAITLPFMYTVTRGT